MRSALPYAWPDSKPASVSRSPDRGQLLEPRAEQVDPLPAGDLGVEAEVLGDLRDDLQLRRGDLTAGDARHHGVACRCAACSPGACRWCPAARRARRPGCDPPVCSEARIEATAGLQMSQPRPRPCRSTSSVNVRMPVTATISNSSARDTAKCSHSAFDCATPAAASSCLSVGTQEPHPVPARVQALSAGHVAGRSRRRSRRAARPWSPRCTSRPARSRAARPGRRRAARAVRAFRCEQRRGVGGQRRPDERPQQRVPRRVADQDAAEQGARVVGDDQLAVGLADRDR